MGERAYRSHPAARWNEEKHEIGNDIYAWAQDGTVSRILNTED